MPHPLHRWLAGAVAALGIAAGATFMPSMAQAAEPGTSWDPGLALQCAVLDDDLEDYEQERNQALEDGDNVLAQHYDRLAQNNMNEQEALGCDTTEFMGVAAPPKVLDRTRGVLTPGLELDEVAQPIQSSQPGPVVGR